MLASLQRSEKGRLISAALLAQLLSILIALTGTFSTLLAKQGVSLPAFQSVINYAGLGVVNGILLAWQGAPLKEQWYKYAALAFLDVQANFCLVLSYRYTSITSVTLLDCFTIPVVLLLSWVFLGARYRSGHWAGALLCLGGLLLLVATDSAFSNAGDYSNPLLGDALVLLGATLYAVSNVTQEKLLGDVGRLEVLAMMGAFGTLWGSIQAMVLERYQIVNTTWTSQVLLPFLGFNAALFSFSSLVPYVLLWSGATMLNLSLLSSDLWAALSRIALFGGFGTASAVFFALSFLLVAAGLIMYTSAGDAYLAQRVTPAFSSHSAPVQEADKRQDNDDPDGFADRLSDNESGALLIHGGSRLTSSPVAYSVQSPPASEEVYSTSATSSELEMGRVKVPAGLIKTRTTE